MTNMHKENWEEQLEATEDWGESFDDRDGSDWADHMGGPDDDEIERRYEDMCQAYDEEYEEAASNFLAEDFEENDMDEDAENGPASRIEEIVEWLSDSKLARKFQNKEGFYVLKGPNVRFKDGSVIDLIDWLLEEEIKGGTSVAGYSIVYSQPGSEYGEKLSFFKIIVDAPFEPPSRLNQEDNSGDDDIPF